jgi:hypothetical protein
MKLKAPAVKTWLLSLGLGLLGLLLHQGVVKIPTFGLGSFWLVVLGWGLLIIATLLKTL